MQPYTPGQTHPADSHRRGPDFEKEIKSYGTQTGRVSAKQENKSNTPSSGRPTHPELVAKLYKKPEDLLKEWAEDPVKAHLLHMASKLVSEANEVAENIYAHVYYGKPIDMAGKDGVIKEFGDMEFYAEGIRAALGITREQCLEANIDKLILRYGPGLGYSNQAAIARVDKQETLGEEIRRELAS